MTTARICRPTNRSAKPPANKRKTATTFAPSKPNGSGSWEETGLFRVENHSDKPKFYGLDFFPYPSGAGISVGHCRNYVPLDVACRLKVMQGYNVLHPMGWDAFGQPAENEAIKTGPQPQRHGSRIRRQLQAAVETGRHLLRLVPRNQQQSRPITTSGRSGSSCCCTSAVWRIAPARRGQLVSRDKTVLANEEVVNGRCWRCSTLVEKRSIPQWFFKITDYAERLLSGLDTVQWPEGIKNMQREWIGRSEGAEVDFPS